MAYCRVVQTENAITDTNKIADMKKRSSQKKSLPTSHCVRIIGGKWRGRSLTVTDLTGLRPTGDRMRETLFNWLMMDMAGSRCLDLFSGSGALGFECESRGAEHVVMLEKQHDAHLQLIDSAKRLFSQATRIERVDSLVWLETASAEHRSFDVIFLDPPFEANLWEPSLTRLEQGKLLASGTKLYVELPIGHPLVMAPGWALLREKKAGKVVCCLYQWRG